MLLGRDGAFFNALPLHQLRQKAVFTIVRRIITPLFIDFEEPVKKNDLTIGAQADLTIFAHNLNSCAFQLCCCHLARNGPFPDQIIKFPLICISQFQAGGIFARICGANTFMSLLRVFGFVFVHPWAGGQILFPIPVFDRFTRRHHCFGGHVDAICAHIRNMTCLIETLGS